MAGTPEAQNKAAAKDVASANSYAKRTGAAAEASAMRTGAAAEASAMRTDAAAEVSAMRTDAAAEEGALLSRLEAFQLICATLARLFSYPTRDEAAVFTNAASLQFVRELAEALSMWSSSLEALYEAALNEASAPEQQRAQDMRRWYTMLFYRSPVQIPLEGNRWNRWRGSSERKHMGETAAVAACYRASGVEVKEDAAVLPDALTCELDFLAFLIASEIRCVDEGATAEAFEFRQRGSQFAARHMVDFVRKVSAEIAAHTTWPPLLFWAEVLNRVVSRCAHV